MVYSVLYSVSLVFSGFKITSSFSLSPSESLGEDEEEEKPAAAASLVLTTQKSTASVTSSEPTGTDSHCEEDCAHINCSAVDITMLF